MLFGLTDINGHIAAVSATLRIGLCLIAYHYAWNISSTVERAPDLSPTVLYLLVRNVLFCSALCIRGVLEEFLGILWKGYIMNCIVDG